ncbi:MAG: LysM peptidoglycan-binding domain-containing protein [Planctomycetota bacterium]|nr:LysM peptidoglycan-binding domain-containing protein [Planctomycetaceae bacterium]MDQ3329833.1 LysM peptidoglycan-binding domain-containing protein [Planctomycetota bacterium]
MARETRIGIALMVLLVGVFGFMVYKKWNGRQPTAVAAAAEANPAPAEGDEPAAAAKSAEPATETASSEPTIAQPDPFATTAAVKTVPMRQAEPAAAFADEAFVRESQPVNVAATPGRSAVPPSQAEPSTGETESVFGETKALPAAADPFGDASLASTPPADNPFTAQAATALKSAPAEPLPSKPATAVVLDDVDDPFGDATTTTVTAETDAPELDEETSAVSPAMSPFRGTTNARSPFGDEAEAELVADAPAIAESDADPFGDSQQGRPTAATTGGAPERLFGDDDDAIDDATLPVAGSFESPLAEEPAFGAANDPELVNTRVTPVAQSGAAGRSAYTVVAENDSYWTISKRVYKTPVYFHALAKFNASRITDPNRLKPGMKVLTPDPQELSARFPDLVSRSAQAEAEKAGLSWDAQGNPIYRVGKADTLTGIAQAHLGRASRWLQIYEWNRKVVPDPKTLKPGTLLRLPPDASRVRLVPEG